MLKVKLTKKSSKIRKKLSAKKSKTLNMKLKLPIFIILGIILSLAVYGYSKAIPAPSDQLGNKAQIKITPPSFDFGQVEYGKAVEYVFKIKNSGDQILEIKRLSTSCGCTTAETSKEEISPGEEIDLKVVYNTAAMSGSHAKGKQDRIIYVKTNDPVNPQVEVKIHAYVN